MLVCKFLWNCLLESDWMSITCIQSFRSDSKWIVFVRKEIVEKYHCKGGVELKGFYEGSYKWSILFGGIMGWLKLGICTSLDIAFDFVKVIYFFLEMFIEVKRMMQKWWL